MQDIIRDFKKHTSKAIISNIQNEPESRREWLLNLFSKACRDLKRNQKYKIWQDGYHGVQVYSSKFIFQKLNYIHQNPVEDGQVALPEEYLYSSARNYAGMSGVLNVVLID